MRYLPPIEVPLGSAKIESNTKPIAPASTDKVMLLTGFVLAMSSSSMIAAVLPQPQPATFAP